jgi:hypothetical protein
MLHRPNVFPWPAVDLEKRENYDDVTASQVKDAAGSGTLTLR